MTSDQKHKSIALGLLNFSKSRGGAERYLVDLCTRLADQHYEVHVYAERGEEQDPRIRFHSVKTIPFPKSLRLLSFAVRATRQMEQGGHAITFGAGNTFSADMLQPHGGVHWAWFWRSLRAYDHPVLWTLKFLGRVFSLKQWASGWIENAPYRKKNLRKIVAISEMVKQDMMHWYRIPEDKIALVYNGVDIECFHPRNRQFREEIRKRHGIGEEPVILFVSNNFRMKGLVFLIKALARIKKQAPDPFKLIILGRDRQSAYRRLAREKDLVNELVFAGSTSEMEKYYGASDLLVHPTFYDACSLTVLEALASGLPVITTRSNGAGGILTQGQEGFVIEDPRDDVLLSDKISFFFNRDNLKKASMAARHLAESYSIERNWQEMEHLLITNMKDGAIRA